LDIPKSFEFKSNAAPSQFGYPPEIKIGEQDQKKETVTVKLSTTNKAKVCILLFTIIKFGWILLIF
jgi:hypothetical protein